MPFQLFTPWSVILTVLTLSIAPVMSAPLIIWDNQEGMKFGYGCEIKATDKVPFHTSQYFGNQRLATENLRNFNGVKQSHLINFSIVKERISATKRNHTGIEVTGVNQRTNAKNNRWFSKRGDQGYLNNNSLRPLEDFVFEVSLKEDLYDNRIKNHLRELKPEEKVYLRVASGETYYQAKCPGQTDRHYTIFRAYQKHFNEETLYYLGVSTEETKVLANIRTYGKVESKSFLAEVGNEPRLAVDAESLRQAIDADPKIEEELDAIEAAVQKAQELANEASIEKENTVNEGPVKEEVLVEDVVANTTLDQVVCIGTRFLNVRNRELDEVLFKARNGERIKVFQSWSGDDTQEAMINGTNYNFKRVEFGERESADQKVGFVASAFIKNADDCPYLNGRNSPRLNPVDTISGLDDPNCCDFPTAAKPTHSYTSGMRKFSHNRSGGRLHAACDLYRYKNEPIRSVAPGKVLRDLYEFYEGTFALEVRHSGGFVVRYGEMTGKVLQRRNSIVNMGESVGKMGKVNSGCCRPMLHFELYSGEKSGPLKSKTGRYKRRSDLMNPTPYLLKWQEKVF